ncbi:MAG: PQQ-binding-like beta-propeller repeat protein [Armatimonadota bacterium]|nr:PQQ-binding-like beta-propeller repeat protein [Armatimonadota bacterium]
MLQHRWFTSLLFILTAVGAIGQERLIEPPFHRAWTVWAGSRVQTFSARGGILYYFSEGGAGAVDLASGEPKWSRESDGFAMGGAINATGIHTVVYKDSSINLLRYDLSSGESRVLGSFKGRRASIAADDARVYVLVDENLMCLDSSSSNEQWKVALYTERPEGDDPLTCVAAGHGKLYVGISEVGFHAVDPASGKVLWTGNGEYNLYDPPFITQTGVITWFEGVQLRDHLSGKPLWKFEDNFYQPGTIVENVLIGRDNGAYCGLDMSTGKLLWKWPENEEKGISMGGVESSAPSDSFGALVREEELMYILKDGKVGWNSNAASGYPIFSDANLMVCQDGYRLIGYKAGSRPPVPTGEEERKSLADKMLDDFHLLDDAEERELITLRDYAVAPLLDKFIRWAAESRTPAGKRNDRARDSAGRSVKLLAEIALPQDTTLLLNGLEAMPASYYSSQLEEILIKVGNPEQTTPYLIKQLQNPDGASGGPALEAVAESHHPDAVSFMLAALQNPRAPTEFRVAAFSHLAGTGGPAGIAAVKAAKRSRGPRPSWVFGYTASINKKSIVARGSDTVGREWRLVESDALGNASDLFLQERKGSGYGPPIFLNVHTGGTLEEEELKSYRGILIEDLVKTEWLNVFPSDAGILRDTDSDGLTDLVESRFGTDPLKGDTDGDRLSDAYDQCPNAYPRKLGDREKIASAAIEARFFGWSNAGPAVLTIEGMRPFEVYGYGGTVIWEASRREGNLSGNFGAGVQIISLFAPEVEGEETEYPDFVRYYEEGTVAKTIVSRSSGGLNGDGYEVTLRKVGDDWYVVGMKLRYVS